MSAVVFNEAKNPRLPEFSSRFYSTAGEGLVVGLVVEWRY